MSHAFSPFSLVTIRKMRSFNLTAKHLPKLPHMLYRNDCIYICTHHHHYIYCPPQSHHSEMRSISSPNNELWRLDCDFTYLIYLNYHRSAKSSIINGFEWKQNQTRTGSKCALYREPYIYNHCADAVKLICLNGRTNTNKLLMRVTEKTTTRAQIEMMSSYIEIVWVFLCALCAYHLLCGEWVRNVVICCFIVCHAFQACCLNGKP